MNKKDVKLVQWFIDFVYCNLKIGEDGDKAKIITELRSIIRGRSLAGGITDSKDQRISSLLRVEQINPKEFLEIVAFQKRFKMIFDKTMQKRELLARHEECDWTTYAMSKTVLGINILDEPMKITFEVIPSIVVPLDYNMEEDEIKIKWHSDWRDQASFSLETQTPGDQKTSDNYAFLAFFRSLAGIPLKSFKRCEDCGHWFLHVSKRERKFCNNLCAARRANKIRRKILKSENPIAYEKELKMGRKRAKKSYQNRIKKDIPNAKFSTRPQKKS